MKFLTRILLITLACVMVLSCFVGCKKIKDEDSEATSVTTAGVKDSYGPYDCELPSDLNYDEAEITIISRDAIGQSDEFFATGEDSANIIKNAVYTRNLSVEARLNVKLDVIPFVDDATNSHATVMAKVAEDVMSSGEYDIITAPAYTALARLRKDSSIISRMLKILLKKELIIIQLW